MIRNMMYVLLGCLILSCLGCVKNIVYYPPRSDVGNSRFFVIVDNKPIGRNIQEVFVTVYGRLVTFTRSANLRSPSTQRTR